MLEDEPNQIRIAHLSSGELIREQRQSHINVNSQINFDITCNLSLSIFWILKLCNNEKKPKNTLFGDT